MARQNSWCNFETNTQKAYFILFYFILFQRHTDTDHVILTSFVPAKLITVSEKFHYIHGDEQTQMIIKQSSLQRHVSDIYQKVASITKMSSAFQKAQKGFPYLK